MLRKIIVSGAAAAFIAVAGLVGVSAPADAGVRVNIGVPGFFGYWGPGYYPGYYGGYRPQYPAYYGGYYGGGYYGNPYYGGYYGNPYYGGYYNKKHCKNVVTYKKVQTQNGWIKKKVVQKRCW